MARGVRGTGLSLVETPEHPYKYSGKWFRTHEEGRAYRERLNLLRRAKRAGFGTTDEELAKFKRSEEILQAEIAREKEIREREQTERDRIRREQGLHPKAHVTGLRATAKAREETRKYLARSNRARMTDAERLDYVRRLYRQRHTMSQTDLLIRVGQVVGAL